MPIPTVSHHQGRAPGLVTKVAVLPPMGEGHQPREELEKTKEAEGANVHQAGREGLIAEFYLVDRGLRHQLPGFSSLGRLVILP